MNLKDWQTRNHVKNSELGRKTGIHESFFTKFHKGERRMSYDTACLVSDATGGEVSLVDLLVIAPAQHLLNPSHPNEKQGNEEDHSANVVNG